MSSVIDEMRYFLNRSGIFRKPVKNKRPDQNAIFHRTDESESLNQNAIFPDADPTDTAEHYGMPRRSGRYPYGSGKDPYQHSSDFLGRIDKLKKEGWTETPENIKKEFGMTTTEFRAQRSLAITERRMVQAESVKSMREDGLGWTEIGRRLGIPESTARSLLNEKSEKRMNQAQKTADFIREQIESKGIIDVGAGVERELGISREKLKQALTILEEEGYPVYVGGIPQAGTTNQQTNTPFICPKGTEYKEIYNFENVHSLNEYTSHDGGETFDKFVYPSSMDSKRMTIRYKEDGGIDRDGLVEIRRGVDDLSLGDSRYSQVRILVDGTHYIKGMAVYSDGKDMPDGVDIIFNTNKSKDVPMLGPKDNSVLKPIKKDDPDNPFGSSIGPKGQSYFLDKDGNRQLSLINKRADEGDWSEWKDKLPAQFLSKQSYSMAEKQLNLALADKRDEYESIMSLTNPVIKKHLLNKFADECDSAAVHLQAAALPGQKYHVIIPINTLKDTEVFAPRYENGTKLALIRYPHGGIFEIPILTVNNKNPLGREIITEKGIDAVGINSKIASQLSGADFDGDTVMCIPTHDRDGKVKIANRKPLEGLIGFEPKEKYAYSLEEIRSGKAHIMKNTQKEMGVISNLITDMTLKGASYSELERAVKHSMVVIDAEKHKLNYKQSEIDNDIESLKKRYQKQPSDDGSESYGGASTLISKSKGEYIVDRRQGSGFTNMKGKANYDPTRPEGVKLYKTADDLTYLTKKVNKRTGEVTYVEERRITKSTKMAETDDARTLISDFNTPMEGLYASFANNMKGMARQARLDMETTPKMAYSPEAKKKYAAEVDSLNDKLNTALVNAPREREAQRRANVEVKRKLQANPDMTKKERKEFKKKAGQQAISKYRNEVDASKRRDRNIVITNKEWEAIQKGAISSSKLEKILNNTDISELRERATPRATNTISAAKEARIKALQGSNYTIEEIARKVGLSTSTVSKYMKG